MLPLAERYGKPHGVHQSVESRWNKPSCLRLDSVIVRRGRDDASRFHVVMSSANGVMISLRCQDILVVPGPKYPIWSFANNSVVTPLWDLAANYWWKKLVVIWISNEGSEALRTSVLVYCLWNGSLPPFMLSLIKTHHHPALAHVASFYP